MTLKDLTVDFSHLKKSSLIEEWIWLIGVDKTPLIVSKIGDLFLRDGNDKFYWLNVGDGILDCIAHSANEFEALLNNNEKLDEWFLPELINQLHKNGDELSNGEVYSFKKLPVLGGEFEINNFESTDISVHFSVSGQIHEQIKDLPDGASIDNISIKS